MDNDIVILEGDAREVVPTFADGAFDVVATDPPYGVPIDWHGQFDWHLGDADIGATIELTRWLMAEAARVLSEDGFLYVTVWDTILAEAHLAARAAGFTTQTFSWVKPGGAPRYLGAPWRESVNPCLIGYRGKSVVGFAALPNWIRLSSVERKVHPTEKPLGLFQYWLRQTPGRVLDPFCGSGTTLVAARTLGLGGVGVELDPEWVRIARARVGVNFPMDPALD